MSIALRSRQPGWPARCLIGGVQAYRLLLQAWIGNRCRFEPSCSAYAIEALQRHGAARGSLLAGGRLLRCHPWCDGGLDPVPESGALLSLDTTGLSSRLGLGAGVDPSKIRNLP